MMQKQVVKDPHRNVNVQAGKGERVWGLETPLWTVTNPGRWTTADSGFFLVTPDVL